jgi:hypothetical protein
MLLVLCCCVVSSGLPVAAASPLQGTNASHLAQCLGLDPSRYGGGGSAGSSMAAALREEAMQVGSMRLDARHPDPHGGGQK